MTDRGLTLLSLATALAFAFCIDRSGPSCPGLDDDCDGVVVIERRAMHASPYPCSTSACKRADGSGGPCLDDAGVAVADPIDRLQGP